MTAKEYQKEAMRTDPSVGHPMFAGRVAWRMEQGENARLLNGLMGLSGEAGEALDLMKKHIFQGHELDRAHLEKELGDVAWYLALSADAMGLTLDDIFQQNIDKLRARYPDGFDPNKSMRRADGDV